MTVFADNLLAGHAAFVAGGTSGTNLAIAKPYASAGAKVAVLSRKPEKVEAAVAEIGHGAVGFAARCTACHTSRKICSPRPARRRRGAPRRAASSASTTTRR